ncbi:hypothetical protein ACNQ2K_03025 [Mycoplasma sp. VS292A]|uniref:hypothetical protein n=1 Tax=Mycoplasma sp. VS292A TaxID=3401680 RepID=UPI003AAEB96A
MNKINKIKQAKIANIVTATIFFVLALAAIVFFATPEIIAATATDSWMLTLTILFYGYGIYVCSILGAIWLISEIVNIILHITVFKALESQEDIALRNDMLIWLVFTLLFLFGIANIVLAVKQNKILKMSKEC